MAPLVYLLCALTSLLCGILLLREFVLSRTRLLLWSSLSFGCFGLSNAILFADFVLVPDVDLSLVRAATAFTAAILLLLGLVWDLE